MTRSGYDKRNRNVLRHRLNIASDGAEVTCSGRQNDAAAGADW